MTSHQGAPISRALSTHLAHGLRQRVNKTTHGKKLSDGEGPVVSAVEFEYTHPKGPGATSPDISTAMEVETGGLQVHGLPELRSGF